MQTTLIEQQQVIKKIRTAFQANQPIVLNERDDLALNDVYSTLYAVRMEEEFKKKSQQPSFLKKWLHRLSTLKR